MSSTDTLRDLILDGYTISIHCRAFPYGTASRMPSTGSGSCLSINEASLANLLTVELFGSHLSYCLPLGIGITGERSHDIPCLCHYSRP